MYSKATLNSEKNISEDRLTKLKIDIDVLASFDSDHVVQKQPLSEKSYREITAQQMLDTAKKEFEAQKIRYDIICKMLEGC